MSIQKYINAIEEDNLVDKAINKDDGKEKLAKLGRLVCQRHIKNQGSMSDWENLIEKGMEIADFDTEGSSYPWEGAANFKSTLITEAIRSFGDRAKTEIMKAKDLVATSVVGVDEDQTKKDSAERITDHMNWQINTEMKAWREKQKKLLYLLPSQGAVFKKTFFDATEGRNQSTIIKYPNFSLDQECEDIDDCNFTEVKHYRANDIWELQEAKLWRSDEDIIPDDAEENLADENFEFLEQYCDFDLDGDGYAEPLLVTVHKNTEKVVRIVARWDLETLFIVYDKNTYNLKELLDATDKEEPPTSVESFNIVRSETKRDKIIKNSRLARITPTKIITYYSFIEAPDGSFLALGYLQILGSTVKGINKTTNSLMNAGELANLQGGWLSKEHRDRKSSGAFRTKAGSFKQTNISASALANSIVPLPFKEPSQVLHALTTELKGDVKEMSAKFNLDQALSPNVPAASVLGVLQEGAIPTSSLLMNVVDAMSKEFQIIFDLNQKFTDPVIYQSITGVQDFKADYFNDIQISPTANAQFSNQMQRIQLAEAQLSKIDLLLQVGGNPVPIIKSYYEALGTTNMEQLFPESMTDEEKAQRDEMQKMQKQQQEMEQLQTELLKAQVEQGNKDLQRKAKETEAKIAEMQVKMQETLAKVQEMQKESTRKDAKLGGDLELMRANTKLAFEKAQTEDEKQKQSDKLKAVELLIQMDNDDEDRNDRRKEKVINP